MSDTPPQRFAWDWVGWWTLMFVGNMPVVVFIAGGLARGGGAVGLVSGLALLYLLGASVCGLGLRVGRSLVWGGLILAATQLIPVIQIGSILLAVWTADFLTGAKQFGEGINTDVAGERGQVAVNFRIGVVVMLAALPLVTLTLFLGTAIRRSRGDYPLWAIYRSDPDAN
jgi:hypothetical protein